jgi:hypothetical protein
MNGTILVVAASPNLSRGIMRNLTELGHKTHVRIIGVQQKEPVDGILKAFAIDRKPIDIRLGECAVAFVDAILFGEIRGWDLIPFLKNGGVECFGISSMYRALMKQSGVTRSMDMLETYAFFREELPKVYAEACKRLEGSKQAV